MNSTVLKLLLFTGFLLSFCLELQALEKKCTDAGARGADLQKAFVDVIAVLNENGNQQSLPKVGERITTGPKQNFTLMYSVPLTQKFEVQENSEIEIIKSAGANAPTRIKLLKGSVTSEGEHRQEFVEIETEMAEVTPLGTKYSVDLNEAIAEASGENEHSESYTVAQGEIKISLKRAKKVSVVKVNSKTKTKKNIVAKNNSFKLKAGQKAKARVDKKTQIATVEILEPN